MTFPMIFPRTDTNQLVTVPMLHKLGAYAESQGFRVSFETHYRGGYISMIVKTRFSDHLVMSVAPLESTGRDESVYMVNYNFLSTMTTYNFGGRMRTTDAKRSIESVKRSLRRLRVVLLETTYGV